MQTTSFGATLTGSSGVNGDAFYISPDNKVFVLSDGASGAGKNGKTLMSGTCIETAKQFDYQTANLEPKAYVDALFWKMNNKLIGISQQNRQLCYGTVIIAVVDNNTLTVTTFGDSPAFLYTGDGHIKQVARNKKRYENMVAQGYITKDEYEGYARQAPPYMGACFDYFLPEIVPNNVIEQYPIKPGDMLFMCCDGVSDWISPETVFATLKNSGIQGGINELIPRAKERALAQVNYYDDITAIAVCCR